MALLFSYGTLRLATVQQALFGRDVPEMPDSIAGFRVETIIFTDPLTVELTGTTRHKRLHATGKPDDRIDGAVLDLTEAELVIADNYETAAYRRIGAVTGTGRQVFVYVDAEGTT